MRGIDSYTLNTVAGWVLGAALLVFGLNALAGVVYHAEAPEEPGMIVEVAEVTPAVEETDGAGPTMAALLADADPGAGESAARACQACHTFDQGGAHRVGPNLWDVVGRQIAGAEGYDYSDALQAMTDQTWTYEALDEFIHNPRGFAPGTKMAYGGMQRDEQRADLLAYLRSLSDDPEPLPQPPAEEAAGEEAPAGEPGEEAAAEAPSGEDTAAEGEAQDITALVAQVDPEAGQAAARACQACHTFEEGGAHRVGPNLWNVVGQPIARHEDYDYSDALQGMSDQTWTLETLNDFIMNPRSFAPGTKMAYGGMQRDEQRVELLAYLHSLSNDPEPLGQPAPETQEDGAEEPEVNLESGGQDAGQPVTAPAETQEDGAEEPEVNLESGGQDAGQPATEPAETPEDGAEGPDVNLDSGGQDAGQPAAAPAETPEGGAEGPDVELEPEAAQGPEVDLEPAEAPAAEPEEGAAVEGEAQGVAALIADMDPAEGQSAARACQACHTFEEGGAHRVGPNLWNIVGRSIAHHEDYNYSEALQSMSDQTWTLEALNEFLLNPRGFAPGTKMAYGGMRRDEQRLQLLAYLNSLGGQ